MLSLNDQLKKFHKMAFNNEINDFVTIDDQFTGSGITVESLVKENNAIVTEMKKIRAIFINFCQLNEKVIKKAQEHELSTFSERSRLQNITNSLDQKMEDYLTKMKELHESTIHINKESKIAADSASESLARQFQQKLDITTFYAEVRKLLSEEENTEVIQEASGEEEEDEKIITAEFTDSVMPIAVDNQNQLQIEIQKPNGKPQPKEEESPLRSRRPVKKGGISSQDLDSLKKQIQPAIEALKAELTEKAALICQNQHKIRSNHQAILEKGRQDSVVASELQKLYRGQQDQKNTIGKVKSEVMTELANKINDNIWEQKFQEFNIKYVQLPLKTFKTATDAQILRVNQRTTSSEEQLQLIQSKNEHYDGLHLKITETFKDSDSKSRTLKAQLEEHDKKYESEIKTVTKVLQTTRNSLLSELQLYKINSSKELTEFRSTIQGFSGIMQEIVLKGVIKKFKPEIKEIKDEQLSIKQTNKQINLKLINSFDQIKVLQGITVKKANFSDLLLYFEKKADKEDFKELCETMKDPWKQITHRKDITLTEFFKDTNTNTKKQKASERKGSVQSHRVRFRLNKGSLEGRDREAHVVQPIFDETANPQLREVPRDVTPRKYKQRMRTNSGLWPMGMK